MPLLNYTTTISALKTVSEIQGLLADFGAVEVNIRYTNRRPAGIAFVVDTPTGERSFVLPANCTAVLKTLDREHQRGRIRRGYVNEEQAERVAWRIVKDWLEAQLAIVQTQMVTLDQVMLAYLETRDGRSLYQALVIDGGLKMLPAGRD